MSAASDKHWRTCVKGYYVAHVTVAARPRPTHRLAHAQRSDVQGMKVKRVAHRPPRDTCHRQREGR